MNSQTLSSQHWSQFGLYSLLILFEETVHMTNVTFTEMLFLIQLQMVNPSCGSHIPGCSSQVLF